jgi:hypothetical protein
MLTIAEAWLAFTRFCPAIVQTGRDAGIGAGSDHNGGARGGGAGPFRVQDRFASSEFTPGRCNCRTPLAGAGCTVFSVPEVYCESPNTLRKVVQSDALYKSVSSITRWSAPFR